MKGGRYRKLFGDTVILGLGTFGSKILVFLMMPFYTAWLSTGEYSRAELITGTANLLIPLACIGITNGIFRFAAEKEADKEAVFASSMALLGLGLGGFLLLSPLLLLIDYFRGAVWLIVLYVLMADVQSVAAQYTRAVDRPKLFAVQGILNTLVTIVSNVLLLRYAKMGVDGYVLSVIIGNAVSLVFMVVCLRLWKVDFRGKVSGKLIRELIRFSLPMIPTTFCWLITDLSDRYVVTYYCGDAVNGIYSAAYKIPTVVNLLSGIFMQAWQFSAVAQSSDEEECRNFYSEVFSGYQSVVLLCSSALVLLTTPLTVILLNVSYREAEFYMPLLLGAAALEAVVSFLATVYLVKKKSVHSFLTAMAGTMLNLTLNFLLIPRDGILGGAYGAAFATLVSYACVLVLRLWDVPRLIRFRQSLSRMVPAFLCLGVAIAAMTYRFPGYWFAAGGAFAVIVAIEFPPLWKSFLGLLRFRRS